MHVIWVTGWTLVQDCNIKLLWCTFDVAAAETPILVDVNKPLNRIFLATCDVPSSVVQDQTLKIFPHYSSCDSNKPGILTMRLITGVYLGVSNLAVHVSTKDLLARVTILTNCWCIQRSTVSSLSHSVSFSPIILYLYLFLPLHFFFLQFSPSVSLTVISFPLYFSSPPLCVTGWELTDSSKPSQRPRPLALSCVQLTSPPRLCLL